MNHRHRIRVSKLSLGLIVALAAAPAFAQQTSAGVAGQVLGANGQPIPNVEVTIVHTESGTVSRVTSDAEGRYTARGLRVGGPYTITANAAGAGSSSQDDIFLNLNAVNTVNVALNNDVTTLGTVEALAIGGGSEVFSASKMGTGSSVTREQIEALPSIARDIQDYIRLDPRVAQTSKGRGEISAGGQNSRFNSIRIDGVSASDTFGLESNNSPTFRQPVSIDAIEEVSIELADYDVGISGATGAVVNAVTKSGTNDFSGSAYYFFRDNSFVRGNDNPGGVYGPFDGGDFTGFNDEQTYGMTFGGPLIRDRLFFFANYEKFVRSAPGTTVSALASNITDAQIAEVQRISRDVYGFDAGTQNAPEDLKTQIEEYAAKIDWNISDTQRASFRYSNLEQSDVFLYGFGNTGRSLSTNWSITDKTVESYVGQLFSDWTDNFSTELKISYREYASVRNPFSRLPAISVAFGTPQANGTPVSPFLNFGTDSFSHVNVLETDTTNAYAAGTYYAGDHEIKFGFDYEDNSVYNVFGQNLFGTYNFASIADYAAGRYWSYTSNAPRPGQPVDSIAADYNQANLGVFIQDRWAITSNLSLMFGVRADRITLDQQPEFNALTAAVFGVDNTQTPDGNTLVQPRFGFNYTFDTDRQTQLRGGVGLFQGAAANVWIGNSFANTGLNVVNYGTANFGNLTQAQRAAIRAQFPFSADPDNQPQPAASRQMAVNIIEPDFEQPSVWKANLAVDHELPWYGLVGSAELLLTQVNKGLYYERLDLGAPTGFAQDGRPVYYANRATNSGTRANQNRELNALRAAGQLPAGFANVTSWANDGVIMLRNTDKGETQQLTLSLEKPMVENWSWLAAYTRTVANEVNPLTSSRAISNWNGNISFAANEDVSSRSNYEIRDRFTGVLSWRKAFFGDNNTSVSVFYEGRSGKPYSWGFRNDANGDGYTNDLFYVPNGPGDVAFSGIRNAQGQFTTTPAQMEAAFFTWLNQNPDLARFAGQVAPRNTATSPFVNTFDVSIKQELPGFFAGNKAEISFDILNFGNLLNKDWGQTYEVGFPLNRGVALATGTDAQGRYIYNFDPALVTAEGLYDNQDQTKGISRWQVQVGFRYKF